MATLRLLLALFLIAMGTTGAAFAISGYFDPRTWQRDAKAAGAPAAGKAAKVELPVQGGRQRFIAVEPAARPAAAIPAAVAVPARPRPPAAPVKTVTRKPAPPKEAKAQPQQQQAAVWWPLANLFKN